MRKRRWQSQFTSRYHKHWLVTHTQILEIVYSSTVKKLKLLSHQSNAVHINHTVHSFVSCNHFYWFVRGNPIWVSALRYDRHKKIRTFDSLLVFNAKGLPYIEIEIKIHFHIPWSMGAIDSKIHRYNIHILTNVRMKITIMKIISLAQSMSLASLPFWKLDSSGIPR